MARREKVLVGPGKPWTSRWCARWWPWRPCFRLPADIAAGMVLGFAAVFYCPGYAITSALLPVEWRRSRSFVPHQERTQTITMPIRSAMAVGLSATTVALAATIMTRGLVELNALSIGLTLIAVTFIASAAAVQRRSKLPPGTSSSSCTVPPSVRPQPEGGRWWPLSSWPSWRWAWCRHRPDGRPVGIAVLGVRGDRRRRAPGPPALVAVAQPAGGRGDRIANHLGQAADYTLIVS